MKIDKNTLCVKCPHFKIGNEKFGYCNKPFDAETDIKLDNKFRLLTEGIEDIGLQVVENKGTCSKLKEIWGKDILSSQILHTTGVITHCLRS